MINGIGAIPNLGIGGAARTGQENGIAANVGSAASSIGASFTDALAKAAETAVGNLTGAEGASMNALQGKGDTRSVVDAVMTAEQSLQAAISIRDKIVQSYLEVSRMQI